MSDTIRIGVIGAGRIGNVHATAITTRVANAELAGVSDISADAAQALGRKYGVPATIDHQALLQDPTIDAIAICSSTDTHAALIIEAAQAGKHIFCEKPIALSLEQIDPALAVVEEAGVKLFIGFQRRFDPSFRQAKALIDSGRLGTPRVLRITSRDPEPPPLAYLNASGGIFMDMTIHDFDMARFLSDSPIEDVYAVGSVLVDPDIGARANDLDTVVITLRYANGAICTIDNCRHSAYGYDQRLEWFGSGGSVVVGNHRPDQAVYADAKGVHSARPLYFFLERYMEAYGAEMQSFVDSVVADSEPAVTGQDGRYPAIIGQAAWRSYREKRPVRIDEIAPA